MRCVVGIDIGGTEIKGGVIDKNGNIVCQYKCATNAKQGFERVKENLYNVIFNLLEATDHEIAGIGIATAGTVNTDNGCVVYATPNLPNWSGFEIQKDVENKFKKIVACENDANAALIGELFAGSAKGYKNVVMVTLGTGVGGAISINGKILHGNSFSAGRLGHMILYPKGKPCNCGQLGCVEKYLSGTAFTAEAKKLGYEITHGRQVFEILNSGDEKIRLYVGKYFSDLANFMVSIKNCLDPELVIIGGGVINSAAAWWDKYFLPCLRNVKMEIKPATLKNTAGIIGAGKLILDKIY